MPLGPWMLPGGMGMVQTVGGDPRFVIDAVDCCCETTTTIGPTTTTTRVYDPGCPSSSWIDDNCPDPLFVVVGTGNCPFVSCDDTYQMDWFLLGFYQGFGGGDNNCNAELDCLLIGGVSYWRLRVVYLGPAGVSCVWLRPAFTEDCPMGVYSFHLGICTACVGLVTVYS